MATRDSTRDGTNVTEQSEVERPRRPVIHVRRTIHPQKQSFSRFPLIRRLRRRLPHPKGEGFWGASGA